MKRKHSPGPWGILDIATHDTITVWQTRNPIKNFHIATVLDYASSNKQASEAEFQRCLANARLIAAAPELLEVVEALLDLTSDEKEFSWDTLQVVTDMAREAIKKARGEK